MTNRSLPLLMIAAALALAAPVAADYGQPWLPDWSGEDGYTSQFWGLHADGGAEPAQHLAPDNDSDNSYGTATATWDTSPEAFPGMSYVQWLGEAMGMQPIWVDEVYGGMVVYAPPKDGGYALTLSLPAVTGSGPLQVFVQFDWYAHNGSTVTPIVDGATDATPGNYADVQIGESSSGTSWYRSSYVFEFMNNPGAFDVDLVIDGAAPMIDSASVTTALNADIPETMPIPEPATLSLLGLGAMVMLRRRERESHYSVVH